MSNLPQRTTHRALAAKAKVAAKQQKAKAEASFQKAWGISSKTFKEATEQYLGSRR